MTLPGGVRGADLRGAAVRGTAVRGLAGLLTLAGGAAALHQLLLGWHWFGLMMLAGVLVTVLGIAGRAVRLPALALVLIQLVAVAVLTTTLYARDTAVFGLLPGPAALSELVTTVETGTDAINHYAPPAPAVTGIMLLLVLGGGIGAALIDLLVDHGLPALTGFVVLAFDAITAFCLPAGLNAVSFLLGGAGWLTMLLVAGPPGRRGGTAPSSSSEPADLAGTAVTAGAPGWPAGSTTVGRRAALASLGLAAVVPALLPGLSSSRLTRLFPGSGGGSGGSGGGQLLTVRDPLVELRRNLVQPENVEVLTYGTYTTTAQYLRLATLDNFDGERWTSNPGLEHRRTDTGITDAEGLVAGVPQVAATTRFTVAAGLSSSYLPVPYPITELAADGGWWYDPSGLDVMSYSWRATGGFTYQVHSLDLDFDPDKLRAAAAAPAAVRARDLTLPPMPAVVAATARRVTAAARNDFDRAVSLQSWFRGEFTYDTSIVDASSTGALVRFLTSRRGYCEQFSATMAVMARILGIPSRVVVGFLPGTQPQAAGWVVTAHEAHAWPELYFSGAGWVRFEPTPAVQSGGEPDWTVDTTLGSGQAPVLIPNRIQRPEATASSAPSPVAAGGRSSGRSGGVHPSVAAGILGAAVVVAVAPAATVRVLRERRWRAAGAGGTVGSSTAASSTAASSAAGGDGAVGELGTVGGVRDPAVRPSGTAGGSGRGATGGPVSGPAPAAGTAAAPGVPDQRLVVASPAARAAAAAVQSDLADMAWDHTGGWSDEITPRQLGHRLRSELAGQPAAAAAAQRLVTLVEQVRYAPAATEIPELDAHGIRADSELVRRALAARAPWWRRAVTVVVPAALRRRLFPTRSAGRGAPPSATPTTAVTAEVLAHRESERLTSR